MRFSDKVAIVTDGAQELEYPSYSSANEDCSFDMSINFTRRRI
jgi:hypothetical protein